MIVHIDASCDNIIGTGVGLIMVATCSLLPKALDASMAECLTLRWALEKLKQLEIVHAVIFTDCLPLANAWAKHALILVAAISFCTSLICCVLRCVLFLLLLQCKP
ncbi:hypothetical protein RIF29_04584 [Crotalaria pallida]|uniref:RNase H type-1 domain-containing protein n=1 Tax=Crotalaria pallida TaxID=3830 RepID=A0AAN9PA45_CROPI